MISVVILGAGNVATHLFKAFAKAENIMVKQWYNRHISAISSYKNKVEIIDDLSLLKDADIYIIAVSDDAIAELSEQLPFVNKLVVHTSGSVGVYDIDKKQKRGVFYPLQTFSKDAEMEFKNVPICIETIDKKDYHILKELAISIGSPTKKVNSDQRRVLHLAAVFVNNFTNQLYRIGHEITESEGAEFDLLKPLILETAKKVQEFSPYMAQTGPAKRNDKKTIKKHLKILESEQHKAIYELLTKSIQQTHGAPINAQTNDKNTNNGRKKL
ncbi:Rossmann-like and DUF2520 domain-containing protein [Hwangdonia lutea]|uniref:Rossmann-like and DUF2520 domain-containing protein n=1 Tax=Hwangdonia lutea TaxID=3075823 RepID=A0AA97EM56_9FLAO|nr:Rossmann-like and DUF2520 domain-containing protein [Hwangdonia sp. SCSIO 19198]WOD43717.1 Rossmann-like and DUF2520 domain-containing protein [Hwangdonia sp. SCSIO 19198]